MKVNLGIWEKLTRLVILLLLLSGLVGIAIWYLPVIEQNERMRKEIVRLKQQIRKEEDHSRQMKSSIDALENDPKSLERLAREKLGYARTGETVVRFEAPVTNSTIPSP
ncbi:MAG: septum formation initiator family protein [Candidatus Omnitrophica bacterium]|nr:septum formation initiator family protein [Candidatus Omnitrophota bacterium]